MMATDTRRTLGAVLGGLALVLLLAACGAAAVPKTTVAPAPAQPAEPAPAEPQATCADLAIRLLDHGPGIHGAIVADTLHLGGDTAPVTCAEPASQSVAGWSIPDDWTAQVQQSQYYLIVIRYSRGNRLYVISLRSDGTTCIVNTNNECIAEVSDLPDDFDLSDLPDDVAPTIPAGREAPPTPPPPGGGYTPPVVAPPTPPAPEAPTAPEDPAAPAGAPPEPYNPRPRYGATGVTDIGPSLSWSAARHGMAEATSFDLYWGTSVNLAADAALGTPITTSYTPVRIWRRGHPAPWRERWLEGETTYYWRVDAKNDAGTTRGPLWYFTTGPATPRKPAPPAPPTSPAPPLTTQEIGAADFGGASLDSAGKASSRSTRYTVDGITAGNQDRVRVSIGGKTLPFTSTAQQPAFAGDDSGAEWRVEADVSAGAGGAGSVVLVLTATESAGGRIKKIVVTDGGAYSSLPTVTIAPPALASGTRATATASETGIVTAVVIRSGGMGYASAPTVTISAPASGTTATATAKGSRYDSVSHVKVTSAGGGYTAFPSSDGPTVTFSAPPPGGTRATGIPGPAGQGSIAGVRVADQGANYPPNRWLNCEVSKPPPGPFTIAGGTVIPAPTRAEVSIGTTRSGKVSYGIEIRRSGKGYTSVPTVTCSVLPYNRWRWPCTPWCSGPLQPAVFTVHMATWITWVGVTNQGSGYTSVPTVTITGRRETSRFDTGDPTAIAIMNGLVTEVTVTERGSGYTRPPTVTFSEPPEGGHRATGYAAILNKAVSVVTLTNPGGGYQEAPAVTFTGGGAPRCARDHYRPPGHPLERCPSRASAAATAVLADGYDASENLSRARQALAGKQLVVRLVDAPPAADGNG